MLPLDLFSSRIFRAATFNGLFAGMAFFGSLSFIPLYIQGVMGGTATQAGSALTPLLLGWVTFAVVGGRLMLRVGYRVTVVVGMFLLVSGFAALARISPAASRSYVTADMLAIGAGMGLGMVTLLIAVQSSVRREMLGIATSATQFFRTIGGTIGVAIMGSVLSLHLHSQLASATRGADAASHRLLELAHHPDAIIDPRARAGIPAATLELFRAALDRSLHAVFYVGVAAAAAALLSSLLIPGGKPEQHSPRPPE
jgi:hypothetical protein